MGCCNNNNSINEKKHLLAPEITSICPKCASKGKNVDIITPKSLLKDCCLEKLRDDLNYKFCLNETCEISYFSSDKNVYFTKDELKVKATLKDKGLDVSTCYCFGYTRQIILDEIKIKGETTALEIIKEKMKDPGCFCEISNPQGSCCLANNISWIKEAKELAK
jgi:hypothetical protein